MAHKVEFWDWDGQTQHRSALEYEEYTILAGKATDYPRGYGNDPVEAISLTLYTTEEGVVITDIAAYERSIHKESEWTEPSIW